MGSVKALLVTLLALVLGVPQEAPDDRLYGRVITAGGDVFEGYLRWDRNEGSWADVLDGSKELPWDNLRDAEELDWEREEGRRERSVNILGLRISWTEDGNHYPSSALSGIRFGHIQRLRVRGDDRALLTLKSGEEVEFSGGSTDLGNSLRDLVVEDAQRGAVELRWRDLDEVEFLPAPPGAEPPAQRRLYGTLYTRSGMEFTGFVSWDVDEILDSDVLDGEERGRDREIPFRRIASIQRAGSSGARVTLDNGDEITLRDSNDVDDGNRGIGISDPGLGYVTVDWDAFRRMEFHQPEDHGAGYADFSGGTYLWGTVVTEDDQRLTGYIRWDNDEEATWEFLNGQHQDVEFSVEFGRIEGIRRLGGWGAEVRLLDGRVFELEGSNDVDDTNKGIYVISEDGEVQLIPWRDFTEVFFAP